MNSQEKKKLLRQYRYLDAEINRLLREREMWMARATKITPSLSGMPVGGDKRGREDAILRIVEIDRDINRRIDNLVDVRISIMNAIDAVEDPTLRRLLMLRYVDCQSFEQIAVDMHYCWRQTLRMHGKALEAITMS